MSQLNLGHVPQVKGGQGDCHIVDCKKSFCLLVAFPPLEEGKGDTL